MSNQEIIAFSIIFLIVSFFGFYIGKKSVKKKIIVALDVDAKSFGEEDIIASASDDPVNSKPAKTPKERIANNLGKDPSDLEKLDSRQGKK